MSDISLVFPTVSDNRKCLILKRTNVKHVAFGEVEGLTLVLGDVQVEPVAHVDALGSAGVTVTHHGREELQGRVAGGELLLGS